MAHPLAIFEKIYVINLPSRRDRYREMAEQLKTIGLGFDSPFVELFEAVRPDSAEGFPNLGAARVKVVVASFTQPTAA